MGRQGCNMLFRDVTFLSFKNRLLWHINTEHSHNQNISIKQKHNRSRDHRHVGMIKNRDLLQPTNWVFVNTVHQSLIKWPYFPREVSHVSDRCRTCGEVAVVNLIFILTHCVRTHENYFLNRYRNLPNTTTTVKFGW